MELIAYNISPFDLNFPAIFIFEALAVIMFCRVWQLDEKEQIFFFKFFEIFIFKNLLKRQCQL